MTRSMTNPVLSKTEEVAGNGLLHRRALLGRGVAFAGALATGAGLNATGAAAELLAEPDWSLSPGDPVPAYQLPSKFAKNVVRTLSNPSFEPRTSQSRVPHQLLDGMITPNGVFFTIVHDGVPDIDPSAHRLLIHGLVKRPLIFSRSMPWTSPRSLSDDQVYALTAYILAQNKLIDAKHR
jgi:sulfane dehydrogenase subunit SoxC